MVDIQIIGSPADQAAERDADSLKSYGIAGRSCDRRDRRIDVGIVGRGAGRGSGRGIIKGESGCAKGGLKIAGLVDGLRVYLEYVAAAAAQVWQRVTPGAAGSARLTVAVLSTDPVDRLSGNPVAPVPDLG